MGKATQLHSQYGQQIVEHFGASLPGRVRLSKFLDSFGVKGSPETMSKLAKLLKSEATDFYVPPAHDAPETDREFWSRRCDAYHRKTASQPPGVVTWKVGKKPIGIQVQGDPHLDDDGCDLPLLTSHLELCKRTPRLIPACMGDVNNNWIGRLVKKYADQTSTKAEGFRLARMYMEHPDKWAFIVSGNHDLWDEHTFAEIVRGAKVKAFGQHQVRLNLLFDNGLDYNIEARHDYKGKSQNNPLHGMWKSMRMDPWPDITLAGHLHYYAAMVAQLHGLPKVAARVGSYKKHDDYSASLQFPDCTAGESLTLVIDPSKKKVNPDMVKLFWNAEEGADYLTRLIKRQG